MTEKRQSPEISTTGQRVLGLDFTKYLLSGDKRRHITMESDNTAGTESDLSDWEVGSRYITSENSEESDEYGIYYDQNHAGALSMFDTAIGSESDQFTQSRQHVQQVGNLFMQMNSSNADSGYAGSLYPIQEGGSTMTDSSGSHEDNSEDTLSNSGSPIHHPVYGSYHKLQNQIDEARRLESDGSLEKLMLHRLPGEYLGMILGIEGGKDGNGTVTSICVKSVTLGGAAHRATGGSKGVCVGDEIVEVNGLDLHTLTHDECVQVFKDMPLRVILGIRRGQKNIPPVAISPLPMENGELFKRQNSNPLSSPRYIRQRELSDSEDDGFAGFSIYQVTVEKNASENLGLSIVPSYGSTKQYYQIKRILPSGAAAQSGQLQVGDRLITCNGQNLRGLTQNHCLNIIRTASTHGNVTFEVIRPVYHGSSMEISVTVNPNSQKNPYVQPYDPQQYSLKSQSYDRQVDVVVTSESEDYLTVSEDEYSRTGRLANIPEVEANEVFASNSVKLAFQKPFQKTEGERTATETEPEFVSPRSLLPNENIDIIDLNKVDTSPYHIAKQPLNDGNVSPRNWKSEEIPENSVIPKSDIDNLSPRSLGSPRSLQIPKTDLDTVSVSSNRPRSFIPKTDLDKFRLRTPSPVSPGRIETASPVKTSYNKRQQVPVSESESISPPFNYLPESLNKNIPTDHKDAVRYNPLYDSNASEATDSETVQDNYIASPFESPSHDNSFSKSNQDKNYINTGEIGDENDGELALPPPIEFSDNQNIDSTEPTDYSPITNIDDLASSVEVSPIHQEITFRPTYKRPNNSVLKLERSFTDLEEASSDKPKDIPRDYSDSELAFNKELTAPFDSVLQEHGECVHKTNIVPVEFADTNDDEILQVVQSYDDGTIVISQFDANEKRESTDSPDIHKQKRQDTRMDMNSEAMLKDALDMEYEQLPDTSKSEVRIGLAGEMQPNHADIEEELSSGRNVIAEKVAKEMLQNEGGNFGYYMESDDEPDEYPGQDEPEPALPDAPPPFLIPSSKEIGEPVHQTVLEINGASITPTDTEQSGINTDSDIDSHHDNVLDSNWSFKTKDTGIGTGNPDLNKDPETIVPVSVRRKVDIAIDNLNIGHKEEEMVVPMKVERNFSAPKDFTERTPVFEDEKSKSKAPPVAPKPSKARLSQRSPVDVNFNSKTVTNDDVLDLEPVQEGVFTATDISEQRKKNIVNVISVVNALKASKSHEDPDVVDKVVKVDKKDYLKKSVGALINAKDTTELKNVPIQANSVSLTVNGQVSPPKNEVLVTSKDEITRSKYSSETFKANVQTSPPKDEVVVTTKQEITKSRPKSETVNKLGQSADIHKKSEAINIGKDLEKEVPVMKTSIFVEKSKSNEKPVNENANNASVGVKGKMDIPPLNLSSLSSSYSDSLSPKDDRSGEVSPSSTYKTTIGVNKTKPLDQPKEKQNIDSTKIPPPTTTKTLPQFKTLSAIKPLSFNPKSLSQTLPAKPVQYKTTINTVGSKPSTGISALGRSSLINSQKTDHPIKRMETMPFEVSILKGILGIGIKTAMTPEGLVKITEILPSGPVGREGNIKVGDYLLSINGTQLTGLPDSKVQQTLRLLPRGLSKLVASPVPPDSNTVAQASDEKSKLAPQQSVPLSSLRKTTVTTNPEPLTISTRKPLNSTKSLPPSMQPRNKDLKSPEVSPRSKAPPPTLPKPKDRTSLSPRGETSPRSPVSDTPVTPTSSPRQQSPRSPAPPVAPKPSRNQLKPTAELSASESREDPNKPIDTVIFASVNSSKVASAKPGPNILPGSVNYDYTEPVTKIGNHGEVSNAVFKAQSTKGNEVEGKMDIVSDTIAPNVTELTKVVSTEESQNNNKPGTITESIQDLGASKNIDKTGADASFEAMVQDVADRTDIDVNLLANRNRSFSTSSDNESYTEFNECNVEENEIPDEIVEEDETGAEFLEDLKSPISEGNKAVKPDDYDSDFEESPNGTEDISTDSKSHENIDMTALKGMAQNIVAEVISTVKQMDLSKHELDNPPPPLPIEEPPLVMEDRQSVESVPPLPDDPPPLPTEAPPPIPDEAPPLMMNDRPAVPDQPPPVLMADIQVLDKEVPVVSQVNDFTLYPDDIPAELKTKNSEEDEHKGEEVIDVVSSYHSAQLHAEKSPVDVVSAHILDTPDSGFNEIDSISKQVSDKTNGPLDLSDVTDKKEVEDSSVNIVIDLYSDIGNKKSELVEQNDTKDNFTKDTGENGSFEGKSISSSDDFLSDADNSEVTKDKIKDNKEKNDITIKQEQSPVKDSPVNGHSSDAKDVKERTLSPVDSRKESDGGASLSPRSDSTYSPRTVESVTSEDEGHGRYTPDVDKVIRMLSHSEEPKNKGEGEVMTITLNKGVTGLGFVIEGGKMSLKGDQPISIKRIFKGGPAENLLEVGDEICSVNDEDISQMRRSEAWNHLKFLPSGDIVMQIRRYKRETTETDV